MVAGELNAAATRERRSLDDVHPRAVVALHVAIARGEILGLSTVQIARDGQRLEKHFRHDHRAAEIQDHATVVEIGHRTREALEIAMTRGAQGRAIGRGMLVNDLGADRRVDGHGNPQLGTGEQHRGIATR